MAVAEPAKVYTVSGGGSSSTGDASHNSSSLPDLLRRHGGSNKRKPRKSTASINEQLSRIELLQDFEFPEASNRIKSSRDGRYIIATGTYKPQMRVWECEQLSLKFERHSDAENVDFVMLSDDWTKSLHIQNDRTVELHTQGGHHTRLRIPRFGRSVDYHFGSATALIGAAGNDVFRLNLDQGRFLAPFTLPPEVLGVNAVDVNTAHGLCAFGVEGATNEGGVELWDSRSRSQAGRLNVAVQDVLDAALMAARRGLPGVFGGGDSDDAALRTEAMSSLGVTALRSSSDGLNVAAGTTTGHVLLYDLRMDKPYAIKDQGFGLPIKSLSWPSDVSTRSTVTTGNSGDKRVLSSDAKVIKAWSASDPTENIVTITPSVSSGDINDVHQIPGTGLILSANEATRCSAWYVPELGVAPKWCSFLDVLTDEADSEAAGGKGTYEDFKFVDQAELERLGLSHLIGSDVLRPYMHGFFMSLALYDKARLISNPTAYEDARERAIKKKLEKMAESRIREDPKDVALRRRKEKELEGIRVNRELAEKISRQSAKQSKKSGAGAEGAATHKAKPEQQQQQPATLLGDARFREMFTNPEFQVDETSREFALLNPSTAARGSGRQADSAAANGPRKLTAVEEEDAESDRESLDPDQERSESSSDDEGSASDSSDEGDLRQFDPRKHYGKRRVDLDPSFERGAVPLDDDESDNEKTRRRFHSNAMRNGGIIKKRSLGERMRMRQQRDQGGAQSLPDDDADDVRSGGKTMSWTPAAEDSSAAAGKDKKKGSGGGGAAAGPAAHGETFGKGLSRGAGREQGVGVDALNEAQRHGRDKRRWPNRSASGNVMRGRS